MASKHSPSSSESSSGSSYQLILDHIFSCPGTYEIPLRTMYTLNCAPRAQPLKTHSPASSTESSPISLQSGFSESSTNQVFVENVMAQMQQLSSQPSSLPPSFITSFLRRCFPCELVFVDFPQALTGIDYLKDLEGRRRREVHDAVERLSLSIDKPILSADDELRKSHPGIAQWFQTVLEKEKRLEALYTQLYVALRRWVMINELSLLPFDKHNCIAMLNSLYNPMMTSTPTARLTKEVINKQRQGFFKYINAVENDGPAVLNNLMRQGAAPYDDNGWPAVTRTLGMYLQLANSVISECASIAVENLSPSIPTGARHRGKVDSGVSLPLSEKRPSTSGSSTSDQAQEIRPADSPRPKTPSGKAGSALEKLARGLRSMGMSRTDVTEMLPQDQLRTSPKKSIRKMKSMGSIGERKLQKASSAAFEQTNDMRSKLTRYESSTVAQQKYGTVFSHEA